MTENQINYEKEQYSVDKEIAIKIANLGFTLYEDDVSKFHWIAKWVDDYFIQVIFEVKAW